MADSHGVEWEAGLLGQLLGRLAPRLPVLAGDEQKAPRSDEVLDGQTITVFVVDPCVRQRRARIPR
jgi:hypothetical protein